MTRTQLRRDRTEFKSAPTPKLGNVYRYTPSRKHCREGIAVATELHGELVFMDTFWAHSPARLLRTDLDSHLLRDEEEVASMELVFNIHDYRAAERSENCDVYEPDMVRVVTAQHGLTVIRYVDPAATRSNRVIIERQRADVERAEQQLREAHSWLESERRELARLEERAANGEQL